MTIPTLKLNLSDGSVSFPCSLNSAQTLQAHLATLMNALKANAAQAANKPGRPSPQKSMEYQQAGDVFLEVFCNPNIWPNPFSAKVLITLRDDRISLNTEAALTQLVEDVNQFIAEAS